MIVYVTDRKVCGITAHNYANVHNIILRKIAVSIVPAIMPHGMALPVFVHSETANGVRQNGHAFVKRIITAATVITARESILNGIPVITSVFVHYRTALGIKIKTCVNV